MNILFINANLHGHINPTLGLVKTLTNRGHRVNYFCSEGFAPLIRNVGASWAGFSEDIEKYLREYRPTDRHPFFLLMEYTLLYIEKLLPVELKLIEQDNYDCVICDSYFGGGCFLEQLIDIPVICSHSSFAMSKTPVPDRMLIPGFHPQLDYCYEILKRINETFNTAVPSLKEVFISKGERNIVYTTQTFNGDEQIHEPEYLFNGPSLDRNQQSDEFIDYSAAGNREIVYISLGSINTDCAGFFKLCMKALADTDYYVFMSIGNKITVEELGVIPDNFLVRNFFAQLEVLKHADVFVTHAGFNSVSEAIYYGVPMLALPQVNDQHMVAKRLVSLKLGISETIRELTPDVLRCKIESIIVNEQIKDNCRMMAQEMREHATPEQTVAKLEEYVRTMKER